MNVQKIIILSDIHLLPFFQNIENIESVAFFHVPSLFLYSGLIEKTWVGPKVSSFFPDFSKSLDSSLKNPWKIHEKSMKVPDVPFPEIFNFLKNLLVGFN